MPTPIPAPRASRAVMLVMLAAAAVALSACHLNFANNIEEKDEWKRTYPLSPGGTLEIRNTNGAIDVQPGDGNTIEIVAERVVRAATEAAAKEALQAFEIHESVTPERVALDATQRLSGLFLGLREVRFHVKTPKWANVQLHSTNGDITVRDLDGSFEAHATNGQVTGTGLSGRAVAETTNGDVNLTFARVADDGVSVDTTNGEVSLNVPHDAKARLSVRVTNGDISSDGLDIATTEKSRRKLDGTIGGGGGMIRVSTTNGGVGLHEK